MPVLVWSRRFAEDAAARAQAEQAFGVKVVVTAEELVAKSDILSVHLALTKDTRNFVNAELVGRTSKVPWAVIFPREGPEPRHPSQLYEAIGEGFLPLLWMWWRYPKRLPPGQVAGEFLLLYAVARFVSEWFRSPDDGYILGMTAGQFWTLPMAMKARHGQLKWLPKQLLMRYLPKPLVQHPKTGFGAPVGDWLRGPLREWAEAQLDETRLRDEGHFDPAPIRRIWKAFLDGERKWHTHLWGVLMFQAWRDKL